MTTKELFEEFYSFFLKNPNATYFALQSHIVRKKEMSLYNEIAIITRIENMRRNLQKMRILKCLKHMSGKSNISTTKSFDKDLVEKYIKYLNKKEINNEKI